MGEEKKDDVKENKEEKIEPVVLKVDMHCVGCARKIRKSIKSFKGVEDVELNMELNMVVVKGNVDPLKLCERVQKKCGKKTEVLSPLPKKENKLEEEKENKKSSEPAVVITVLKVNMDCEGCAQRVERAILKMKGVQAVHSDFTNHNVTVKGTMEPKKLVEYVYRRAGKHAQIVPPPQKAEDDSKKEDDKKAAEETKKEEDKKDEEKKDEGGDKKEGEEKKEEAKPNEKKEGEKSEGEAKKDGEKVEGEEKKDAGDQPVKEEERKDGSEETVAVNIIEEKKNEFSAPKYVIEHVYPPQLFSDENPNACSIM